MDSEEGEGEMIWENGSETCVLSYVNESPVQVQCMIQDAQGWCTAMTQRDGMGGRWEVVQDGKHMYTHGGFMSIFGNQYNIVK